MSVDIQILGAGAMNSQPVIHAGKREGGGRRHVTILLLVQGRTCATMPLHVGAVGASGASMLSKSMGKGDVSAASLPTGRFAFLCKMRRLPAKSTSKSPPWVKLALHAFFECWVLLGPSAMVVATSSSALRDFDPRPRSCNFWNV